MHRLAVYPEYVANPGRWLDGGGGRATVAAATLRLADSHGLARGSHWSPGLAGADGSPGRAQHSPLAAPGHREGFTEAQNGPGSRSVSFETAYPSHREGVRLGADGRSLGAVNSSRHASASAAQPVPAAQPADARSHPDASPSCGSAHLPLQGLAGSPGTAEARGMPHAGAAAEPPSPSHTPSIAPAQPPLRPAAGSWAVAVNIDGLLVGAARPPADPGLGRLLAAVVDRGHELSEAEIVRLFDARGADFDAVCSAAGACHVLRGCSARWPVVTKHIMSTLRQDW